MVEDAPSGLAVKRVGWVGAKVAPRWGSQGELTQDSKVKVYIRYMLHGIAWVAVSFFIEQTTYDNLDYWVVGLP